MPRIFTGIRIPPPLQREMARLILPPRNVSREISPADLHLTLHFLGDLSPSDAAALQVRLRDVAAPGFSIGIRGAGTFGSRHRAEILWLGIEISEVLIRLHDSIGEILKSLKLPVESRPFTPHLTVARLKVPSPAVAAEFVRDNSEFHAILQVDAFQLFSSDLTRRQDRYQTIEEYRLRHDDSGSLHV